MTTGDDSPDESQPKEICVYLSHVLSLFVPGRTPSSFRTVSGKAADVGDITKWADTELDVLIEEGRRKFDQQSARFDRIRQTAQVALPTGVALLVVAGGQLREIRHDPLGLATVVMMAGWLIATASVLLSTLGAAAILVTKGTFGAVLPTLLSQEAPGAVKAELAKLYAEEMATGENTVNTRLTLQWWSVLFLAAGGVGFVVLWGIRIW